MQDYYLLVKYEVTTKDGNSCQGAQATKPEKILCFVCIFSNQGCNPESPLWLGLDNKSTLLKVREILSSINFLNCDEIYCQ